MAKDEMTTKPTEVAETPTPMQRFHQMREGFSDHITDGEMYCALRSLFFLVAAEHEALKQQLQAVTAERDKLREYARHRAIDNCTAPFSKCTCGLEQLLRPEAG